MDLEIANTQVKDKGNLQEENGIVDIAFENINYGVDIKTKNNKIER